MIRLATLLIALALSLNAESILKSAHNANLLPIPSDKNAQQKLINSKKNPITPAKVALGKMLFFDPRLSKSNLISCNSCHNLATAGIDSLAVATGHKWRSNPHHLNSPTVYNALFFDAQFWDGRAPSLEVQAQGPIQAAPEMAASKAHVVNTVTSMPGYVAAFKKAYGNNVKITFTKITDTIALFERTLITPSRYDAFLEGEVDLFSAQESEGLQLFIDKGCASCHNGIALGGSMQAFGVVAPYKYEKIGDFKGNSDGLVKVPTLRNITQTAPYFHNGAVKTLKEAIIEMGRIQLGIALSDEEATKIETFLHTLDGKMPTITYPVLPMRSASTPLPDMN